MKWHRAKRIFHSVWRIVTPIWVFGFAVLLIAVYFEPHGEHATGFQKFMGGSLSHLAVALIVGALLVSVDKAIFFDELKHEIVRLLQLKAEVVDSGLMSVIPKGERRFPGYAEFIKDSDRLTIVANYGKDFVADWREDLVHRFGKTDAETEWFLIDPTSKMVEVLATKQLATPEEIAKKIKETEADLKACFERSAKHGSLKIYRIPFPLAPTATIYASERKGGVGRVAVTFYTASSNKGSVPLLCFEDHGSHPNVYSFFTEDIQRFRSSCQLEWSSAGPTNGQVENSEAEHAS